MVKKKIPPRIQPGYIANFETLKRAHNQGDLALVSAIRKADQRPVVLVCAMSHTAEGIVPMPLAVMVEGDPFELFEGPIV